MRVNMADDGESLESWLNKATNPSNRQEDWEYIMGFCDQVNKELEGPQISVRLLAHKVQSPQEWEAMQALTVLEACMRNCGRRFHNEIGKFRFLNELIKVVSPRYLGDKVPEKVKTKVIEMLYTWSVSLPDETKICEAYQMLKNQGIISVDPDVPLDATLRSSPAQPRNPVFDDERKSKRLAELLRSKKPEDLQEANRLIKNMVKEDEVRTQKATKQKSTLEEVNNRVKLLNEMLAHFSPDHSTDGDRELIKELYGDSENLRRTVVQLATDTEDNDSNLGDILQASDDLSNVITRYKKIVGQTINGHTEEAQPSDKKSTNEKSNTEESEILIDLVDLDVQSPSPAAQLPASSPSVPEDLLCGCASTERPFPSAALSLLDEELLSLGINEPDFVQIKSSPPKQENDSSQNLDLLNTLSSVPAFCASPLLTDVAFGSVASIKSANMASAVSVSIPPFSTPVSTASVSSSSVIVPKLWLSTASTHMAPVAPSLVFGEASSLPSCASPSAKPIVSQQVSCGASQSASPSIICDLQDLDMLDLGGPTNVSVASSTSVPLLGVMSQDSTAPPAVDLIGDTHLLGSLSPVLPVSQMLTPKGQELSLTNVFVPLSTIKPSELCPVTAYDKNGVRVLLHFATDSPPGRPDVLVMVASMLNTSPLPVRNLTLQAAVPKTMKVRLQSPSGTELAPFNPVLPPAAVTQVILLANPLKEKVRMKYKLIFVLGEQPHTEVGEVDDFPPTDRWGAL
ncbi:ADP-ribosylation factor-binding protein GGA3a isoform X2 [Thalassophryne amazonica]|uniref:ADP-ribosylation factor-binding protein GGA3a isoform X2 n=1 Tax=Thalassophryne amazonica TaxID=390379 RepID=UPI00147203A5|nr:ADP-ribosylation factor-binding protein GGA3a isoform X2 [Thalassophryne amazonica]